MFHMNYESDTCDTVESANFKNAKKSTMLVEVSEKTQTK